ncbi:MAG: NUDIX hydrolase [Roseovarius sp.]
MTQAENREFAGAKLALFIGDRVLVLRRDDRPDLPWPGYLDLPGGGREGSESPEACALRETHEEVGLVVRPDQLVWKRYYPEDPTPAFFFAAHLPAETEADIVFGSEGQGWLLMAPEAFVQSAEAVPHFRVRLADYLQSR